MICFLSCWCCTCYCFVRKSSERYVLKSKLQYNRKKIKNLMNVLLLTMRMMVVVALLVIILVIVLQLILQLILLMVLLVVWLMKWKKDT